MEQLKQDIITRTASDDCNEKENCFIPINNL